MQQSQEIEKLASAMVSVQAQIKSAPKDSSNPFFKSKYADLESVWGACRDALTKNGLAVIQTIDSDASGDYLCTTIMHSSGQWHSGKSRLMVTKSDPQSMGSAITYARRYALAAAVGVVQSDDDGEGAMSRQTAPRPIVSVNKAIDIRPGHLSPVDAHMEEADRLQDEINQAFGSIGPDPKGSGSCSVCGEPLKRTKKNDAFYCPRYKDKSQGAHDFIPDEAS